MSCNTAGAMYPLTADIYYPVVSQSPFGEVTKVWTKDRTLVCNLSSAGSRFREQLEPNVDISIEDMLVGRFKEDIRISSDDEGLSLINIAVTDIKDRNGTKIYIETSGEREDLSTIFEVATVSPQVGPFGTVEYYRVILKRSENQGFNV